MSDIRFTIAYIFKIDTLHKNILCKLKHFKKADFLQTIFKKALKIGIKTFL